jgi:CO/xanthine dehydrogenase Mo-binding subunit
MKMHNKNDEFNLVGKPVTRIDGLEKVTGTAKFADDQYFPGQLTGVMLRLPVAHARLGEIEYSPVRNDKRILAICDHRDVPGENKIGLIRADQPVFCREKIVTPGDVVAMLVGESEQVMRPLLKKIKVNYEVLPVLTDPESALQPGAPLIHPETKSNLIIHHPLRKGSVQNGFAASDHILEQTYTTQRVEHAYIEPECVTALPLEGSKGIRITGSIQNPFNTRRLVAAALGWPLNRVQIHQAELGGSFGGKDDSVGMMAARAAIGALKTGHPVKIRYTREESISESYKRHPYIMHYRVGFMQTGKIMAMQIEILADGGAYASMSPFVTWRSVVQATGPYEIENVQTDVRAVYTNNPYTGAMRGFGSPQPIFAQESLMDEIALFLNKSPVEIRRLNGYRRGSVTATGQVLRGHDVTLQKVLNRAAKETGFVDKWKKYNKKHPPISNGTSRKLTLDGDRFVEPAEVWQKGIGLAVSFRGCSLGAEGIDAAAAYISLQQDGSVYLLSGLAENGQGMRTTYAIIAAEVLGIGAENIQYLDMNTANIPDSGATVASRATLMGGGAVKSAAGILRRRLENVLRKQWNLSPGTRFTFSGQRIRPAGRSNKSIGFSELCQLACQSGVNLAAIGWYEGPKVHWEEKTGQGPAYFTYVYGCQVAEIRVNVTTGEVYVDRITAVHDPGKVINLQGALGQVFGGVTQGAGYGLWEEVSCHQGIIREMNFDQFLIPTAEDIGEIVPVFIEGRDKYGPWGAKSLGEPTLELTAAAIANAIRNAVGKRYFNLPLNLEEIILQRKLYPQDVVRGSGK